MMRLLRAAAILLLVTVASSCDSGPTDGGAPTPGTLKVLLTSPNGVDGAILIRLDGAQMSDIAVSGAGRNVYLRTMTPTRVLVAIVGPVTSGEMLSFTVPDTRQSADYVATVLDVSDEANELRATPSAYTLQVRR